MQNVVISRKTNGVHVSVGCQEFVFEDIKKAMAEVQLYLLSPRRARERWAKLMKDFSGINYFGEDEEPTSPPVRGHAEMAKMAQENVFAGGSLRG